MTTKTKKMFDGINFKTDISEVAATVNAVINEPKIQKKAVMGRPKKNPHAQDVQTTIRMPKEVHKLLRLASVHEDRPQGEIIIDAIIKTVKKYEKKL